jgi:hypothetical protein
MCKALSSNTGTDKEGEERGKERRGGNLCPIFQRLIKLVFNVT